MWGLSNILTISNILMKTLIVDCIARGGKPNRNISQKAKDIKRELLTEKYCSRISSYDDDNKCC